jgi:uncharacterized protein YcbK (DUF882 family)
MSLDLSRTNDWKVGIGRRSLLRLGMLTLLAGAFPRLGFAALEGCLSPERSLSFHETHTGESLELLYWSNGRYLPEALAQIDHVLRDFRTGEVKRIDTGLLDLLYFIGLKIGARKPFHVISGYRSPKTNALLRKSNKGIAKNSLHIVGKAIDVRLPGLPLSVLRRVAVDSKGGGVGYYPRSDFVHIDVGPVRYW